MRGYPVLLEPDDVLGQSDQEIIGLENKLLFVHLDKGLVKLTLELSRIAAIHLQNAELLAWHEHCNVVLHGRLVHN